MTKKVDVYVRYVWDCPICDASNYVVDQNAKMVHCCRCGREFEIGSLLGK